jgi:uncharacterized cupin superfamily protein
MWQTEDTARTYERWRYDDLDFGEVHWLRQEQTGDRLLLCGVWRSDPCEFPYTFLGDQTIHVVEGSATIDVGGEQVQAKPGTFASFRQGDQSHWTIHTPFKTIFVTVGSTPPGTPRSA